MSNFNQSVTGVQWVQCKKTGQWYDPHSQFRKLMSDPQIVAVFKRMGSK